MTDKRCEYFDEVATRADLTRHELQTRIVQLASCIGMLGPLRVNLREGGETILVTGSNKSFVLYLKDLDRVPTIVNTVPLEDSYQVTPRVEVTPVSVTITGSPISEEEHSPGLHYHIDDVGRDMIEGLHAVYMAYTDPAGLDEYIRSVPEGEHSREWSVGTGTGSEVYFDQQLAAGEAAKLAENPDLKFWYWGNTVRYRKYTKGKVGQTLAICNVRTNDYTDRICRLLQAADGLAIEDVEAWLDSMPEGTPKPVTGCDGAVLRTTAAVEGPAAEAYDINAKAAAETGMSREMVKELAFGSRYASKATINVDRVRLFTPLECNPRDAQQWLSAREVPGGCLVRMSTRRQSGDGSDHTLTFVPNVRIVLDGDRYMLKQDLRDQPQPPTAAAVNGRKMRWQVGELYCFMYKARWYKGQLIKARVVDATRCLTFRILSPREGEAIVMRIRETHMHRVTIGHTP